MNNGILYISSTKFFGGGEVYLLNIIDILGSDNMYFIVSNSVLYDNLVKNNIDKNNILQINNSNNSISKLLNIIVSIKFALDKKINTCVLNSIDEVYTAPFMKLMNVRTIIIYHTEYNIKIKLINKLLRNISTIFIDRIVCVANHIKWSLPNKLQGKSTVVINRPNKKLLAVERIIISNDIRRIIFVGRVTKSKGVDDILEIAENFKEITFSLLGPVNNDYIGYNLPRNVRFEGFASDVIPYLTNSDLAIFPSRSEGMPYALLEAAAVGLPIIASDIPAHKELDEKLSGLILYTPGNLNSLKEKVNILRSNTLREKMSASNYINIRNICDERIVRDEYKNAYGIIIT